jgi:hypothetical protein
VEKALGPLVQKAMAEARVEAREFLEHAVKAIPPSTGGEPGQRTRAASGIRSRRPKGCAAGSASSTGSSVASSNSVRTRAAPR